MPDVGEPAPAFEVADHRGNVHSLQGHRGSWIVLYFYPKDDTPGCTTQACGFRDALATLRSAGAVVLGASADDADAHRAFADEHALGFPLLVDHDGRLREAYGVWVEKERFGRTSMGVARTTFLIGPDGTIARVWRDVTVEGHADEVRAAIEELEPSAA